MGCGNSKTLSRRRLIKLINRKDAVDFICEEHENIMKIETPGTCDESTVAENDEPSRYADTAHLCHTMTLPGESSEYKNASYIDGYRHPKKYITCPAPLKNTRSEFWKMVWNHKSQIIVMLCNTIENGQTQCYRYWIPIEGVALRCGELEIKTVKISSTRRDYTITELMVTGDDGGNLKVTHFWYEQWQEHDLSPDELVFTDLLVMTKVYQLGIDARSSSIVVHCNNGLERSMAFCAVDICLTRLEKTGKLNNFVGIEEINGKTRSHYLSSKVR
ncbi:tyrosine-protein phosphatase non-receptor type 9-like [Cydia pomonella]|uniref:tyrosine-protein phosphatase non-receptor type 9-like n=1 Tax=Cydia pomonella TaxID=82600 RepID=UPI002ADDEC57|nr:tyrosine-protein phosphatase non-receptor type 9-like [Cydia pomonella]